MKYRCDLSIGTKILTVYWPHGVTFTVIVFYHPSMRYYTTGTGQILDILRHSGSEPLNFAMDIACAFACACVLVKEWRPQQPVVGRIRQFLLRNNSTRVNAIVAQLLVCSRLSSSYHYTSMVRTLTNRMIYVRCFLVILSSLITMLHSCKVQAFYYLRIIHVNVMIRERSHKGKGKNPTSKNRLWKFHISMLFVHTVY